MEVGEAISGKAQNKKSTYLVEFLRTRTLSFEATRSKYPNYLKTWTSEDDRKLEQMWCEGASVKKLALTFGRNPGAIQETVHRYLLPAVRAGKMGTGGGTGVRFLYRGNGGACPGWVR